MEHLMSCAPDEYLAMHVHGSILQSIIVLVFIDLLARQLN
jgi:hypothetical protein